MLFARNTLYFLMFIVGYRLLPLNFFFVLSHLRENIIYCCFADIFSKQRALPDKYTTHAQTLRAQRSSAPLFTPVSCPACAL